MSKLYKILIAGVVAITFPFGSANSFEGSGLSIGIIGSNATFNASGSERERAGALSTGSLDSQGTNSEDVSFPSIFIEYTGGDVGGFTGTYGLELIPGTHSIGSKSRTEDDTHSALDDDGTYTGKAEVENHVTLYVEPGYTFNESVTLYGKVGINHMTVNSLESIDFGAASSSYGNVDVIGGMYGAGIKYNTSSGIFLKLEHTINEYEQVVLSSTTGNQNLIKADIDSEATRLALGYNF